MPGILGNNIDLYVDRDDLTAQLKDLNLARSVGILDSTTFGATAKTKLADIKDAKLSASGYWSGSAGDVDEEMTRIFGAASNYYTAIWEGATLGKRANFFQGINSKYDMGGSLGNLVAVTIESEASGPVDNGNIIMPLGAYTNTASMPSWDFGAAGANWACLCHVLAVSGGTPSMPLQIQHSADNVTFVTFTTLTASGLGSFFGSGAGPINRYVRFLRGVTGTTPSFTALASFAMRP